jgi:predicted membrane protein
MAQVAAAESANRIQAHKMIKARKLFLFFTTLLLILWNLADLGCTCIGLVRHTLPVTKDQIKEQVIQKIVAQFYE